MSGERDYTAVSWRLERYQGHYGEQRRIVPEGFERPNGHEEFLCDEPYYPSVPDADKDWLLIAAAPELLAALKLLASGLEYGDPCFANCTEWHTGHSVECLKVRAALAKAEGRES